MNVRVRPFELRLLLAYAAIVLAAYLLVEPGGPLERLDAVEPVDSSRYYVLPLVGLPFVLSLVNWLADGRPIGTLLFGLAPGIGFVGLAGLARLVGSAGDGDAPLWALAAVFAGYGLVLSAAGYLLGRALSVARSRAGG